jgi:hypothetical protein
MTRRLAPAAAVVAALALVAAGCGGDSEPEVSASTQWAGDLCTAVDTWQSSLASITSTLTSDPTKDGLESAASDARDATETLIDTVKGLGSPDTESGDQAKSTVDSLADSLQTNVDTVENAVEDVSGVQGLLTAVSTVSAAVANMTSELSSSLTELQSLGNVDNELRQSFSEAESCNGVIPGS